MIIYSILEILNNDIIETLSEENEILRSTLDEIISIDILKDAGE